MREIVKAIPTASVTCAAANAPIEALVSGALAVGEIAGETGLAREPRAIRKLVAILAKW